MRELLKLEVTGSKPARRLAELDRSQLATPFSSRSISSASRLMASACKTFRRLIGCNRRSVIDARREESCDIGGPGISGSPSASEGGSGSRSTYLHWTHLYLRLTSGAQPDMCAPCARASAGASCSRSSGRKDLHPLVGNVLVPLLRRRRRAGPRTGSARSRRQAGVGYAPSPTAGGSRGRSPRERLWQVHLVEPVGDDDAFPPRALL